MKVIIAGSRDITSRIITYTAIKESGFDITEVVCGEAKGPDKNGAIWARENGIPVKSSPAIWGVDGVYDRSAGYKRNIQMADYADALIAVWNGISGGTAHMINVAKKKNLKVFIYTPSIIISGGVKFYGPSKL